MTEEKYYQSIPNTTKLLMPDGSEMPLSIRPDGTLGMYIMGQASATEVQLVQSTDVVEYYTQPDVITVGTTSVLLLPLNKDRKTLIICNDGNVGTVYLSFGNPASQNYGLPVYAKGNYQMASSLGNLFLGEVYAISDRQTGVQVLIVEGNSQPTGGV